MWAKTGDPYQGAAILKVLWPCCLCCPTSRPLSCSELPPFLQAQSCVAYWGKITGHVDSHFGGTENQKQQCDVLHKNQVSWLSRACLKITPVLWELNSSLLSRETPEQNRESCYPGFVSLHVPWVWFHLVRKEIEEGHEAEIIMAWYVSSVYFFEEWL